jgi:hypothetical protein
MNPENNTPDPQRHGIMIMWRIPTLACAGDGAAILDRMLSKIIGDALRQKGFLCPAVPCAENQFSTGDALTFFALGDSMTGILEVNDLDAGAITIRAALDSIGALPFSEIGWVDETEGKWCRWYPEGNHTPFIDNLDRLRWWSHKFNSMKHKSP